MVLSRDFLKTGKTLARLTKKKRERSQIKTINESRNTVTDTTAGGKNVIRDYYEQLQATNQDNLETYNFPQTNNKFKIASVIKNLQQRKAQDSLGSWLNFTKHLKKKN